MIDSHPECRSNIPDFASSLQTMTPLLLPVASAKEKRFAAGEMWQCLTPPVLFQQSPSLVVKTCNKQVLQVNIVNN